MGLDLTSLTQTVGGGGASITLAAPAATTINTGGLGDMLLVTVGYGNSTDATPTISGTGWASLGAQVGGAGSWGVGTGNRGVVVWWKVSDGTDGVTVTNGGTGTDRTLRGYMTRVSLDLNSSGWATPVLAKAADNTSGTAFSIAPGSDPGGLAGDAVVTCLAWTPNTVTTSGSISSSITWPGAVATGATTQGSTGSATNGNNVRANTYYAPVAGTSTGNISQAVTLSAAAAGAGALIRLRASGTPLVANAGENQQGIEPGYPFTLDASFSAGSIATYQWEDVDNGNAVIAGTGPFRTLTADSSVAGLTRNFRVKVIDGSSTSSAYDTVTVDILRNAWTWIDSTGTERPVVSEKA